MEGQPDLSTRLSLWIQEMYWRLKAVAKESIVDKTCSSENLPSPLSFDKLRMVSLVEPFAKEG